MTHRIELAALIACCLYLMSPTANATDNAPAAMSTAISSLQQLDNSNKADHVLVAVYLQRGKRTPEMRTEVFDDKSPCRDAAARYVDQVKVGQSRAFCLPVIK